MAYNKDGFWTPENDDVQTQVGNVVSAGGVLMKQASGIGAMQAAKRGLGNSSIAIGAAQAEVLNRATAIGGQNAAQIAGKNLQRQGDVENYKRTMDMTGMQEAGATSRAAAQNANSLAIAQMQADNALKLQNGEITFKQAEAEKERINALTMQGNQIASSEGIAKMQADNALALQKGEITFKQSEAEKERLNALALQTNQIGASKDISANELAAAQARQDAQNQAEMERLGFSTNAQSTLADKTIAAERERTQMGITAQQGLATQQIASTEKMANTDAQVKLSISDADRQQNAKVNAANMATTIATAHMQASAAVMNNADIPAVARDAYAKNIQAATEANIGLVEQTLGVDLAWGNNVVGRAGKTIVSRAVNPDGTNTVTYDDGTSARITGNVIPETYQ